MEIHKHDDVLHRLNQKLKKASKKTKAEKDPQTGTFKEIGGPKGLEPTRYNDWERKGLTRDF